MQFGLSVRRAVVVSFGAACLAYVLLMNLACMLLRPELFQHPHWGISYFGSQPVTFVPYYGGFAIMIAALVNITVLLRRTVGRWRPLRYAFWSITVLAVCIALTSPMHGVVMWWSHIIICLVQLIIILATQVWALCRPGGGRWAYLWFALTTASGGVILASSDWAGLLGLYAWGELALFVVALLGLGEATLRALDSAAN